eukprot:5388928-Prymnesium_polylepis.1
MSNPSIQHPRHAAALCMTHDADSVRAAVTDVCGASHAVRTNLRRDWLPRGHRTLNRVWRG